MELRPGLKLHSAVCDAQVVVVRAPGTEVDVACGGTPMVADGQEAPAGAVLDTSLGDGPLLGKRYADDEVGIELLCTRPGKGALTVNGQPLELKAAKPLPASD